MIDTATAQTYILGTLLGLDADDRPIVNCTLDGEQTLQAVSASAWVPADHNWDAWTGKNFVCIAKAGSSREVLLLGPLAGSATEEASGTTRETIHLKAGKELILECGEAKIQLRADGKIVVLGGNIIQRSRGPHKIRGASVQIN